VAEHESHSHSSSSSDEDAKCFRSGAWHGHYINLNQKADMDFSLKFRDHKVRGKGHDPVGDFVWSGTYNNEHQTVSLTKQYVGKHSVKYEGKRSAKLSFQGTWTIGDTHGEFELVKGRRGHVEPNKAFRSGRWHGFYVQGGHKDNMDLSLRFDHGTVSGKGHDLVGGFTWSGTYDNSAGKIELVKQYTGKHAIYYSGACSGKKAFSGHWSHQQGGNDGDFELVKGKRHDYTK